MRNDWSPKLISLLLISICINSNKKTENIDDFVARCRLQANKCKFRDNQETEERLLEQIITGTKAP